MHDATRIDLYQLTSLVTHHRAGHTDDRVVMTFFSRRLPRREADGEPARAFLLWVGLRRCLEHLAEARVGDVPLEILQVHPILGPALRAERDLVDRLRAWRFSGTVRAPAEGTVLTAGRAVRTTGERIIVMGWSGEGEGVRGGPPRLDSPKADINDLSSPLACGTETCIAMNLPGTTSCRSPLAGSS